jgi:phage-related protein
MIEGFVADLERLAPSLLTASTLLFDLLGAATEFGFTVLDVLGPALSTLTRGLTNVFRALNNTAGVFAAVAASAALIAPIVTPIIGLLSGPLIVALGAVVGTVAGVAAAFRSNFANIRDYLTGLWDEFKNVLPSIREAFNSFVDGVDIQSILDNFAEFEDILGNQLMKTLNDLQPVFDDLITFFNENQEEFETFGEALGTLVNVGIELATVFVNLIFPAIRNFVIPAIRAGIDALDFMIDKLATAIELTQAIAANDFEEATDIALEAVGTSEQQFAQQIQADQQQQQEFNERIEVIVEGDTDVVRDVAARTVNEESRAARRNTGTPSGVR